MKLSTYGKKEIEKIRKLLQESNERYLLLTGGVGVGKTLYAKELAKVFATDTGYVEIFPFGEHFCYENFIYGLSIGHKNGELTFQAEGQRFLKLCERAFQNPEAAYVAIWDDINRTNISQTLGEVLSALESKDIGNVIHAGENCVSIPDNLYIIATMNPLIGKENIDYAWMRRFLHYNIESCEEHFGFDWKGESAEEEYKQIVDISWDKAYTYDEQEKEWKANVQIPIVYDENGKINETGLAYLRQYQWDIYMHIKIMFERYFMDPQDVVKRKQYMLGHGMFLTYNEVCSYGENLVLFHEALRCTVAPLLEKYLEDGVLIKEAKLDVDALNDISGKIVSKMIIEKNNRTAHGKNGEPPRDIELLNFINDRRLDLHLKWSEWYWFLGCNLLLRRVDRRMTPKPKHVEITLNTKYSWLMEREQYIGDVYSQYTNTDKHLCHQLKHYYEISGEKIYFPQQVTSGREYIIFRKSYHIKKDSLLWDDILKEAKYTCKKIEERNKYMCNIRENKLDIMQKLNIRQMILQGPPGTSKTYGAKYDIIAPQLLEYEEKVNNCTMDGNEKKNLLESYMIQDYKCHKKSCGWDMVQFHPSYGYEDFVRGITVSTDRSKNVVYETVDKILGKMCKLAEKYEDDEDSKFFLIIDEINRADVATVFGELIYALECRGEEVSIPYAINGSHKLRIPKNLYIIGTMNTADKSIGTIDYAIRRRFLFFDCMPDVSVVRGYIEDDDLRDLAVNMMENLKAFVDKNIDGNYHAKDLYIGHTYFLVDSEENLKLRLEYQILPILREYYENGVLSKLKDDDMKLNKYLMGKEELTETVFDEIYKNLIEEPSKEN